MSGCIPGSRRKSQFTYEYHNYELSNSFLFLFVWMRLRRRAGLRSALSDMEQIYGYLMRKLDLEGLFS